jgi:hypothetical protein
MPKEPREKRPPGPPLRYPERVTVNLALGTMDRVEAALEPGQTAAERLRYYVEIGIATDGVG